jgi:hypothetical protein
MKSAVVSFKLLLLTFPPGLETRMDKGNFFVFIDGHNSDEISWTTHCMKLTHVLDLLRLLFSLKKYIGRRLYFVIRKKKLLTLLEMELNLFSLREISCINWRLYSVTLPDNRSRIALWVLVSLDENKKFVYSIIMGLMRRFRHEPLLLHNDWPDGQRPQ